jgi:hypothetical protein
MNPMKPTPPMPVENRNPMRPNTSASPELELELEPLERDEYEEPLDRELELDERELLDDDPPRKLPPPPGLAPAKVAFETIHAKAETTAKNRARRRSFMSTARRAAR